MRNLFVHGTRALLLAMVVAEWSLAAEILTVEKAVEAAIGGNRSVASARLEQEKSMLATVIARTGRYPVFSVNALGSQSLVRSGLTFERGALGVYPNVGPIPGTTTTLSNPLKPTAIVYATAAQPLSQQYRVTLGIRMARIGEQVAVEKVRQRELDAARQARSLYFGILQLQNRLESLAGMKKFLERLQAEVAQQVAQRTALQADLLKVVAQVAEVELEMVKLRDPMATQRAELNRLMGRDPEDAWELDVAVPTEEIRETNELLAQALAQRPELRLAELQVQKANLDVRAKNAERIPDVNLTFTTFSTVNLGTVLPGNLSFAGLQATWDVFDWGRKRTEVRQKRLTAQQAELERADVEARIRVEVAQRRRKREEARAEIETAERVRRAAEEGLRIATNRYEQKEALLSDVLQAQAGVAEASRRYVIATLGLATAEAELKRAVGEK